MGYGELVNSYIKITEEIGRRSKNKDKDISNEEEIKSLRIRQKELSKKIDEYNGVKNDD